MNTGRGGAPKYAQIAATIRADIIAGRLQPGDRVPSEPALTDEYGVSKNTASEALRALVAEGLIVRRAGAGSFVAPGAAEIAEQVIRAPAGTRVTARLAGRGDEGLVPGLPVLVIEMPGQPAEAYPADRASVIFA